MGWEREMSAAVRSEWDMVPSESLSMYRKELRSVCSSAGGRWV